MRWIVGTIATLLIVANTFVNVDFWMSLGESIDVKIIAGVWAIGLSMAEFCFPIIAAYCVTINPITRVITWAVASVAMGLSIAVCTLTLTSYVEPKIAKLHAAQQFQQSQQDNQNLNHAFVTAQINAANATAETISGYNKANKLTAGSVVAIDKLEVINTRIDKLLNTTKQNNNEHKNPQPPALQGVARIAERLGVPLSTFLTNVFLALALLIEAVALLSCFYLRALSQASSYSERNEENLPENLEPIRQKVLAGEYGDEPAFRVIRDQNQGVRFSQLQLLREWMIKKGELIRGDRNRVKLVVS